MKIQSVVKSDPIYDYIVVNENNEGDVILRTNKNDYLIKEGCVYIKMGGYLEIIEPEIYYD